MKGVEGHTGTGKDRKGGRRDGLRFTWEWLRRSELSGGHPDDKRRVPCQTCCVDYKGFRFESIAWHKAGKFRYQASVELGYRLRLSSELCEFATRVEAQKYAENMVQDFCRQTICELSK